MMTLNKLLRKDKILHYSSMSYNGSHLVKAIKINETRFGYAMIAHLSVF